VPDELGIARCEFSLYEVEVLLLGVVWELLAPDGLLEHVHQMNRIGRDLLRIEIKGTRQDFESEAGGDAVHSLVHAGGIAVFLNRLRTRIGVLQAFTIVDPHLRIQI